MNKIKLNKENIESVTWHKRTNIVWDEVSAEIVEGLEPNYVSKSGSAYYYLESGIVRKSNHWGRFISNCSWYLRQSSDEGRSWYIDKNFNQDVYGFVSYSSVYHNIANHIIKREIENTLNNSKMKEIEASQKRRFAKKAILAVLKGDTINGVSVAKRTAKTITFSTDKGNKRIEASNYVTSDKIAENIAKILNVTEYFNLSLYESKEIRAILG